MSKTNLFVECGGSCSGDPNICDFIVIPIAPNLISSGDGRSFRLSQQDILSPKTPEQVICSASGQLCILASLCDARKIPTNS